MHSRIDALIIRKYLSIFDALDGEDYMSDVSFRNYVKSTRMYIVYSFLDVPDFSKAFMHASAFEIHTQINVYARIYTMRSVLESGR